MLPLACSRMGQITGSQRVRVTGLGKGGWLEKAEFELLRSGESQVDWKSNYPTEAAPIVVDFDEKGDIRLNGQMYSTTALKDWLANTVQTFGDGDPVILRAKAEAPLPPLEQAAGIVYDSGIKNVYMHSDDSTQRAYSVELRGQYVPLTRRLD
jgi:biopolymer transport protein ExbD